MSVPARKCFPFMLALVLSPAVAVAQPAGYCCREPQEPHSLTMCSPLAGSLTTRVVPEGLEIRFDAPPRETSSWYSEVFSPDSSSWGVGEGQPVPGLSVSGQYLGVRDQRIEVAVLQIGTDADSGIVGTDVIRMVWSSVFRTGARAEFTLDASNAGRSLPFAIPGPPGTRPDTTVVPGMRITIQNGLFVRRSWRAVFDVEDFEGFHVWRWASDPTQEPRVVGTYSKLANVRRPSNAWPVAAPTVRSFTFLDRFVIDGNVYHYAVTTYDQGFDRIRGGALEGPGVPFDSPLPVDGCDSQLRVDFLRPPPVEFQSVQAVPNPYRQINCDLADPLSTCTVRFIRMPSRGTLLIFTLAGDLVREFSHPDDAQAQDPPGTLRWDTTNQSGREVASGVYIYKIIDLVSGLQSYGRVAIIR